MPNYTTKFILFPKSLPQKLGQRKQLVEKKDLCKGAQIKERHEFYSLKEGVSPLGHPSLPQSHCIYRGGGKPPLNSITHNKTSLSTTNEQSCLNSSQPTKDTAMLEEQFDIYPLSCRE